MKAVHLGLQCKLEFLSKKKLFEFMKQILKVRFFADTFRIRQIEFYRSFCLMSWLLCMNWHDDSMIKLFIDVWWKNTSLKNKSLLNYRLLFTIKQTSSKSLEFIKNLDFSKFMLKMSNIHWCRSLIYYFWRFDLIQYLDTMLTLSQNCLSFV